VSSPTPPPAPGPTEGPHGFRRDLGPWDATLLVIGAIIGAGIFINPYIVARRLDSGGLVLLAWVAGGVIALAGALAYAELGALFPRVGGQYGYLRDAYHPVVGFLYGWGLLLMIESGAIAAVALIFAEYALRFVGASQAGATPLAIAAIAAVSVVNYLGVKPGSRLLNVFVVLKVGALALLIGAGLILGGTELTTGVGREAAATGTGLAGLVLAFGAALVPVMFSYGGWQNANYVAEEIREPRRNLPRSLLLGTGAVVVIYVLVNGVYLAALGHGGLAGTTTPAADVARHFLGPWGDRAIALAIAVSTFGFLDLTVLAPTRVYYAMAADGVFFPGVARLHPRHRSPTLAIVIQSLWAVGLLLTGTYAQLVDYVVFADWIFFGLTVGALFVFRRRIPLAERPPGTFTAPLYPVLPALFVVAAVLVVASVLATSPLRSGLGALLLATGVPAFFWWRRRYASPRDEGGEDP